jgi:hypothetical protein
MNERKSLISRSPYLYCRSIRHTLPLFGFILRSGVFIGSKLRSIGVVVQRVVNKGAIFGAVTIWMDPLPRATSSYRECRLVARGCCSCACELMQRAPYCTHVKSVVGGGEGRAVMVCASCDPARLRRLYRWVDPLNHCNGPRERGRGEGWENMFTSRSLYRPLCVRSENLGRALSDYHSCYGLWNNSGAFYPSGIIVVHFRTVE